MARKVKNAPAWLVMLMILYATICAYLVLSVLVESAMRVFPLAA